MNTPRNSQARNHASFKRIRKQLLEHDNTCAICGNEGNTIDHIRPVDTFPNPLDANTLDNCRVLCRSCNSRLGARYVNAKTAGRLTTQSDEPFLDASVSLTPHVSHSVSNPIQVRVSPIDPNETLTYPRFRTNTDGDDQTRLGALRDLAHRVLGVELMPWQEMVLGDQLGLGPDGRPVFRQSVVSVARQNGKSVALKALVLYWLVEMPRLRGQQQTVLTTAHRLDLAAELFNQLAPILEAQFQAKVIYSYGRQSVELPAVGDYPGARWLVRAATPSAGHGLSVDLAVVDELWGCSADSIEGGIIPTMRARRDPLLSCWSTAGTEAESDVFKRMRERGLADIDTGRRSKLYYAEWSPPSTLDPLTVEAARWANPALGITLEEDTIVEELRQPNREEVLRTVCNLWVQSHRAWLDAGLFESFRADIKMPADGGVLAVESASTDQRFVGVRAVEVGNQVHCTVEFIVDNLGDLWAAVRESQKAHKGQTLAIGASLDVHLSPELKGRAVLCGVRELQKWTVIVRSMIMGGQVRHTGEQLLIEQVSRAVAVKHQGHLSLSSARSPGDTSLCRAMVWAVAQAGKPKVQSRVSYAFAD